MTDPETFKALILGIIQGLTEFLPVSSSGHLEIGKALLGSRADEYSQSLTMTVVLHAATALATLVVFRNDVREIMKGLCQWRWGEDHDFAAKVLLSMVPAVAVGLLLENQIAKLFSSNMLLVGAMLVATGTLLLLAGRAQRTEKSVSYGSAFIIGVAQAVAILPGISRSGATISTSVLLGIDRIKAARFSFLMVVPLILGKMAKDILSGDLASQNPQWFPLLVGFVAAFVAGFAACKWMLLLVKHCQLWWFSIYCFIVGAIALLCGLL